MSRPFVRAALATAALFAGTATTAQLLPSLPSLPVGNLGHAVGPTATGLPVVGSLLSERERRQVVQPTLDSLGVPLAVADLPAASLLELRGLRLRQLLADYRGELESDDHHQPVRRGVLLAVSASPAALSAATRLGFRPLGAVAEAGELGLSVVRLAVPARLSAVAAYRALHRAVPDLALDYDHVYEPAGGALLPVAGAIAMQGGGSGPAIAMIDGGVASHPSLAGASVTQRAFAGPAKATGHGTAVASLLVGDQGPFRGAARGARLFVGDVFGGSRAAGSASTIVRALGWAAAQHPAVISISLAGPPNLLLAQAMQALSTRGIRVVAAVGNDGPAAPVQYPAAYPGVVAVTAVDAHDRALPEAGRASKLDFAAPGADMAAALPGQGYARVRGTSFAVPLVAARLALRGSAAALVGEAMPGKGKVGRGIVCRSCRTDPQAVGAK
ncbi:MULTISPECIES: S8 family serine peptidase [Sphingomonas]|uniref:S8 family serine peptidase n=1 Tax=Sphingomonas TaxID=13687 RepID=UPI000DEF7023|nr:MULTISPECIES: S8 family serine peptidase [Sphingomonas]